MGDAAWGCVWRVAAGVARLLDGQAVLVEERGAQREGEVEERAVVGVVDADLEGEGSGVGDDELLLLLAALLHAHLHLVHAVLLRGKARGAR